MPSQSPSRRRSRSASTTHRHYPHLHPRTLSIPASRVRKHWRPLPQPTQDRIRTLLLSIQQQSLATLQPTSRNGHARLPKHTSHITTSTNGASTDHADAITSLIARLVASLPKMTFPPTSTTRTAPTSSKPMSRTAAQQEADFSLPQTQQRTRELTTQLASAKQAAKMLRMQIREEEAGLRRDREEVAELERNSRSNGGDGGRGKLHPLAVGLGDGVAAGKEGRGVGGGGDDGSEAEEEGEGEGRIYDTAGTARRRLRLSEARTTTLAKEAVEGDEALHALIGGLTSHLGSMRNNTAGLDGVRAELRRARRAVRLWEARTLQTT